MERKDGHKSLEELNELFRRQYGMGATTAVHEEPADIPAAQEGAETPPDSKEAEIPLDLSDDRPKKRRGKFFPILVIILAGAVASAGIIFGLHWASSQRPTDEKVSHSAASEEEPSPTQRPEPTETASSSSYIEEENMEESSIWDSADQEAEDFAYERQEQEDGQIAESEIADDGVSGMSEGNPGDAYDAQLPADNAYMTREELINWQSLEADASAVPIELNTSVSVYSGTRAFLHLVNPVYSLYTEQIRIYAADNVDDVYYQSEKLAPGSVLEAVVLSKPVEAPGNFVVEYTVINVKGNVIGTYPIDIEMHPAETA